MEVLLTTYQEQSIFEENNVSKFLMKMGTNTFKGDLA